MTQPIGIPSAPSNESNAPLGEVAGGSGGVPVLDLQDFLWKTHSYMNDYIRFADTKAAVVIALSTALLGGLIAAEAHHGCSLRLLNFVEPAWKESWLGIGASFSILFLCGVKAQHRKAAHQLAM